MLSLSKTRRTKEQFLAPCPVQHGHVPSAAEMRYPMGAPGRGCGRDLDPIGQHRTMRRAIGSAGERLVHTEEVTGSIPVSPTRSEAMWGLSIKLTMGAIPVAAVSEP